MPRLSYLTHCQLLALVVLGNNLFNQLAVMAHDVIKGVFEGEEETGLCNTNMTRRLQSRKAELYEQYRAGRISREKFADIQKTDSEKLARLSSRAEEIKRLLVEHYESRGNLAAGKRTADQIILLKDYDPEIIRNFVERVRVYPSGEIEIDMRTSSGFEFVTAS